VSRLPPGALPPPRLPVAGDGYAIGMPDGAVLCGATSRAGDRQPALLERDHRHNLERLARLANRPSLAAPLDGRVGWRVTARDRLPVVGAMPQVSDGGRLDQPRLMPREAGLFVHTGLGSRGITWATLNAQVLASAIAGVPSPLESSLLDAIDPARFAARAVRRSAS
jgi:tRNA 5-methylaminomethyl-2-thiouridine biosynthesis bifunctional protein